MTMRYPKQIGLKTNTSVREPKYDWIDIFALLFTLRSNHTQTFPVLRTLLYVIYDILRMRNI